MIDFAKTATNFLNLGRKISEVYTRKMLDAHRAFYSRAQTAAAEAMGTFPVGGAGEACQAWAGYATDCIQRWVLFWDTLRQRGNNFVEHERAGKPPLLVFDYETVVDGRKLARPVNYALVRIIPPEGVAPDEDMRPFIIIDPRAGHGPGIGGFKQDSQVGVALQAGHPVYFVIFFPQPEPGQTLLDVCDAEARFVGAVAERHPASPRPAVVGNCQGGWAAMMLAAARPEVSGPLVINGAPMSYWSGSWSGGESENPMRYLGGLLGGSWLALLTSDLGNGLVDGAHFVANFERLNPANTLWTKYYNLFAKVDTEPPRFLEFERWWGGYFLMNEAEIRWIVDNLFVGNRLARGEVKAAPHTFIDLKAIRSPIIIFSSAGDNITPPQQALNWIADVYDSTEEIKANGQVIVGLLHPDVGHLGIFVSGRVAKKEHAQIVEVLRYIESLRPGLYVMEIHETAGPGGRVEYEATLEERRLEDLRKLNRLERKDEKAFAVVATLSEATERLYDLFARPFIRPLVNEGMAAWARAFHPLRWPRWAVSDLNPLLWPVAAMAEGVKVARRPAPADNPYRKAEQAASETITAALDLYRDLRDTATETLFFQVFGPPVLLGVGQEAGTDGRPAAVDPRELPLVKEALAAIGTGGYAEAVALAGMLIGKGAGTISLARMELIDRLTRSDEILSQLSAEAWRRIKAEQAVVAELEPEAGLLSLPKLLAKEKDRQRLLALVDETVVATELTPEQKDMLARIQRILEEAPNGHPPHTAKGGGRKGAAAK
jgi:pimeloyl-ACP methyl ester carboxylesterase